MLNNYERATNAERKLQLIYWLADNLKANETDEALITNLNLIQNLSIYTIGDETGMYKTLVDNWEKIEEEGLVETEQLLPLYYGNMFI